MPLTPETVDLLKSLPLGLAFAGLLASGYEAAAGRPVSFRLLETGNLRAVASIPLLLFSAPAIIIRNTVRSGRLPMAAVVVATAIAGFWGVVCGRLVLDAASLLIPA